MGAPAGSQFGLNTESILPLANTVVRNDPGISCSADRSSSMLSLTSLMSCKNQTMECDATSGIHRLQRGERLEQRWADLRQSITLEVSDQSIYSQRKNITDRCGKQRLETCHAKKKPAFNVSNRILCEGPERWSTMTDPRRFSKCHQTTM